MPPRPPHAREVAERETAAMRDWLLEAAACLVDSTRPLACPPSADLQPAYEAVLASRQQIEQSRHDLIESTQMQSLQTVGSILAHDLHNLSLRLALLNQNLEQFYGEPGFLQSAKRILEDTVERMRVLVDGFRERQEVVVVKIPTDVNEVLRTVARQTGADRVPRVELVEDYGPTPPIWADSFFLANAMRVLIENALDAMPDGGTLWLTTREGAGRRVELEIQDSGTGMSEPFIEKELFAPFRSGRGRGLGLGMYICQHIIQLHDGTIQAASEVGRGTRFRLSFPALAEPAAAEAT